MAYKQKGMSFGEGTGYRAPQSSNLKAEWSEQPNEAGYITKTKSGRNLFGRKRNVTKYYDPVTGKKVGKKVDVARGKGDPRPNKVKLKKVNPGLTQSGGVGKIRLDENPWEKPTGKTDPKPTDPKPTDPKPTENNETNEKINRAEYAFGDVGDSKGYSNAKSFHDKGYIGKDKDGKPTLKSYKKAWNDGRFTIKDGKRCAGSKCFEDSDAGYQAFVDDSEAWWAEQARLTENEKLKKANQSYGRKYDD